MATTAIDAWFSDHPDLTNFRAGLFDLNGTLRGKRLPVAQSGKVARGGLRMPLSVTSLDIWGADIENSPLVFDSGDADGICRPTGRGPFLINWLSAPSALVPVWMFNEDSTPFDADPRQALARVVDRYTARGWRPMVGTELEFCLFAPGKAGVSAAISPATGRDMTTDATLSMDEIDHFDGFLGDVYAACRAFGIPADAAISEAGTGQFEINLAHGGDALSAADDAAFFKRLVRGVARAHGMAASFMAKPRLEQPGNGLHVHFSVLDADGRNIFDDGTDRGSAALHSAVAGCLAAMQESALVFAPHLNSYRRFEADSHAPTAVSWGFENRTAAIRIPGGPAIARRIEHRVAGADANPYLVLAALLGSALLGIERAMRPPEPVAGNTYDTDLPRLPGNWRDAIDRFEGGSLVADIFPPLPIEMLVRCKRQERDVFNARMSDFEIETYLEIV